jgi:hypothetical protein
MFLGWRFIVFLCISVMLAAGSTLKVRRASAEDAPAKSATSPAEDAPADEPAAATKYTLAYKFQPNQVMRFEVSHESEIKTHVKDETETVRNSSIAKRHFTVKAVDEKNNTADLELSIDWVHMLASFENPNRPKTAPVEFQSDDPNKHPEQFNAVLSTIGKPRATIRFSSTGAPVKVLEGALPPPPKATQQLADGPAAPPLTDATPETYFVPLPEGPVAVGDTWKERFDIFLADDQKNRARVTIQRSYKLAEVKGRQATIELWTAVLTPIKNPAIEAQLIQREISGRVIFDLDRGAVVSRESGLDKTVVEPFGARSSMRAKSMYREKLLDAEATADRRADDGAATTK